MLNTTTLTPILGTDKSNPAFSVYSPVDDENLFEVYFGLALLEKVKGDADGIQFKYLLGRLYNAGIKRSELVKAFKMPLSTIRRYGEAAKSDDPEKMMRSFSGQGAEKKLTSEIENYVRLEFRSVYPENKYTYSSEIIKKVKEIFDVSFSSEAFREIFNEEKRSMACRRSDKAPERKEDVSSAQKANICDCPSIASTKKRKNRNDSLSNCDQRTPPFLLKHAGLSLLLPSIKALNLENSLVEQWLASVLLGAVNIERSGGLDFQALDFLLGIESVTSTTYQRRLLKSLASDPENVRRLFRANASFIKLHEKEKVFFYDPHGVKYSGMRDILRGWCGSIGKTNKVNYQDFMHSVDGYPVYFEIHDNYLDMRERLIEEMRRFSGELLPDAEKPTFIVDRGIYGKSAMEEMDSMGYGLVTWGKGYKKDAWDDGKSDIHFKRFLLA